MLLGCTAEREAAKMRHHDVIVVVVVYLALWHCLAASTLIRAFVIFQL